MRGKSLYTFSVSGLTFSPENKANTLAGDEILLTAASSVTGERSVGHSNTTSIALFSFFFSPRERVVGRRGTEVGNGGGGRRCTLLGWLPCVTANGAHLMP